MIRQIILLSLVNLFVFSGMTSMAYAQDERPRVKRYRRLVLTRGEQITIKKKGQFAKIYTLFRHALFRVSVRELNKKNIEFKILRNGKVIFQSGVQKGYARGELVVRKGKVVVSIVNGHWLKKKLVSLSVSMIPLGKFRIFRRGIRIYRGLTINRRVEIGKKKVHKAAYIVPCRTRLKVRAIELLGKNIEFYVKNNGKVVFKSGVKKGVAKGYVLVNRGTILVGIKNGNWLKSKMVMFSVAYKRCGLMR